MGKEGSLEIECRISYFEMLLPNASGREGLGFEYSNIRGRGGGHGVKAHQGKAFVIAYALPLLTSPGPRPQWCEKTVWPLGVLEVKFAQNLEGPRV